MNKINKLILTVFTAVPLFVNCGHKEAKLNIEFPERFEGKTVELMNYKDSTILATAEIKDRMASFTTVENDSVQLPQFMTLSVDGRICAYYIAENGQAYVTDSTYVAKGTPLNDKFATLLAQLDSIENLDDMNKYIEFSEKTYNENKSNPIGDYFGIEWLKFAEPGKVDSMLNASDPAFVNSRRVNHYRQFANHRMSTSPGKPYKDIIGETADGRQQKLSALMPKGKYTIIDFWASWCPYCIKEIPELKQLRADFGPLVEIIGVAVRDLPDDTRAMIEKQQIEWPVLFNTEKVPYDLYGFSGIPHHILVDPDGIIVSRGESARQLADRLEAILASSSITPAK